MPLAAFQPVQRRRFHVVGGAVAGQAEEARRKGALGV